jgi:hypothetical protein
MERSIRSLGSMLVTESPTLKQEWNDQSRKRKEGKSRARAVAPENHRYRAYNPWSPRLR